MEPLEKIRDFFQYFFMLVRLNFDFEPIKKGYFRAYDTVDWHFSGTKKKLLFSKNAYRIFKNQDPKIQNDCEIMGMKLGLSPEKYRLDYLGAFTRMCKYEKETGRSLMDDMETIIITQEIDSGEISEDEKETVKTKIIHLDGHTKEVPIKKKDKKPEELKLEDDLHSDRYGGNPGDIKEYEYPDKEEYHDPRDSEFKPEELSPKTEKKPIENQTSILIKPKKQIKTQEEYEKECQEISKEQIKVILSRDSDYLIPKPGEKDYPVFHENMLKVVHMIWLKRNPGYIITSKPGSLGTISYPDIS